MDVLSVFVSLCYIKYKIKIKTPALISVEHNLFHKVVPFCIERLNGAHGVTYMSNIQRIILYHSCRCKLLFTVLALMHGFNYWEFVSQLRTGTDRGCAFASLCHYNVLCQCQHCPTDQKKSLALLLVAFDTLGRHGGLESSQVRDKVAKLATLSACALPSTSDAKKPRAHRKKS